MRSFPRAESSCSHALTGKAVTLFSPSGAGRGGVQGPQLNGVAVEAYSGAAGLLPTMSEPPTSPAKRPLATDPSHWDNEIYRNPLMAQRM